ncbi:hypothetical protein ACPA0F_18140 [Solibacillus silvestris]
MAHVLDDIYRFKSLVLSGIPKLYQNIPFESEDERIAVTIYSNRFGFRMDPWTGQQLEIETDYEKYMGKYIEGIISEVHNAFRGSYGI